MNKELPKAYNSKEYEDKIYKKWEKSGYFNPDNLDLPKNAPAYTIILPPPNITDKLHLGHSSMLAIEDLLIRYHRMKGYRALWLPGTDHAAIATQNVVEKKLLKEEGKTRHDLGREKFLEKVWKFVKITQSIILHQTRKMGASLDWSREAFTLDEQREKAVKKMFVDMYEAGAIYRGERIVNWCPRCHSTLADDEVEYKDQKAKLYTFKYSKDFPFTIATTRPETKLGDTAVAVNPKDKRYKKYVGKIYEVDFVGIKLKLKIIADRHVETDFGTGALGVTPAHSMADWQMAEANNLEIIKVIGEDGKINDNFLEYSGEKVEEARKIIIKKLRENNLLEKEEEIKNNLSVCYRCNTPIEPLLSKQWFVNVNKKLKRLGNKSLKQKAIEAAKSKEIKFIPERFEKRYIDWMENLHDWCVSRQIWFGHRIPVWYKTQKHKNEEVYVGVEAPEEKINFVFLHGFLRTPNVKDPLNWLNKKLKNKDNFIAKLPNSDSPNLSEQMKFVYKNAKISKNTIIVTHSIGGILAMKFIEKYNLKIKKLVLIAPPMQTSKTADNKIRKKLKDYGNGKFNFEKIKKLVDEIVVFCDINDHIILPEEPMIIAKKLNAKIIEIKAPVSHFNCVECKEILDEIQDTIWTQDPDSLDTWFSSGMWTFSTLGWPDNFKNGKKLGDLAKFHSTQVLETGYDILTLWISRMIMMSLFALQEVPFENVYLHGMVLDKHGKKMSKSKGNGIDPLDMIDKFGADAVRLSLLIGSTPGNDVRIFEEKIAGFRNMVNKLWNISRYVIGNWKLETGKLEIKDTECPIGHSVSGTTLADKWILNKLENLIKEVSEDLDSYRFSQAGERLRDFTWNDFADWYVEVSKFEKNSEKNKILIMILQDLLKLWHPFMPFVTEAIWPNIKKDDFLMVEKWPSFAKATDGKPSNDFEIIQNIIIAIRAARSENKVEPAKKIKAVIYGGKFTELIKSQEHLIKNMRTGIDELDVKAKGKKIKDAIYITVADVEIYLINVVDKEKEKIRIKKEIKNLKKLIKSAKIKLSNKEFTNKAPEQIVKQEKEKLALWEEELKKIKKQ